MIQIVPITAIYTSLCAVLVIALAIRIVLLRRAHRVGLGDGGQPALGRAVRVHGNATEYLPTALLLLLLLELNGAGAPLLHLLGVTLLLARLLHAWGLSQHAGVTVGRFYGTAATWLVMLTAAGLNLYLALA